MQTQPNRHFNRGEELSQMFHTIWQASAHNFCCAFYVPILNWKISGSEKNLLIFKPKSPNNRTDLGATCSKAAVFSSSLEPVHPTTLLQSKRRIIKAFFKAGCYRILTRFLLTRTPHTYIVQRENLQ